MPDRRAGRGYSLVELVVTVVVLSSVSLLLAFTGASLSARQDANRALASLDRVTAGQRELAATLGVYTPLPSDLPSLGRGVRVTTAVSDSQSVVSIVVGSDGSAGLAASDGRGGCRARRLSPVQAGAAELVVRVPSGQACHGSVALAAGTFAVAAVSVLP